jgi:hypothetical protein
MPLGEPGGLWSAAAVLRAAAVAVTGTPLAASGGQVGKLQAWTGDAASEAGEELAVVAQREHTMADRLVRAAAVLSAFGDDLDAAQRTVATLQRSWEGAVPADPLAAWPGSTLAGIAGTHAVVSADLQLAANVAAHRLRALVGEVVAVDAPGRRGTPSSGWADPAPSDAAVRGTVLAGLPLAVCVVAEREASELAQLVVEDLRALAAGDDGAADRAVARLGARSWDPVVAQALWQRLDPEEIATLFDGSVESGAGAAAALAVALGTSFAVAANPRSASGLDAPTRSRLDAWREPWLARLATSAGTAAARRGGVWAEVVWVHGMLLRGARQAGVSPGARYAATVGVAIVATDRDRSPSSSAIGVGAGRPWSVADDPVLGVACALEHDPEAARAWLLAPLPGATRALVLDHLVTRRYRAMDPSAAAASLAAVAALVTSAGRDPASRDAVMLDAAFLGAIGSEARTTPEPDAYWAALSSALGDVGTVLSRHPDALVAVLDDSAGPGVDTALVPFADRLTRPGRDPGTWEAVLPDRPTSAALLGALAFDGPTLVEGAGTAPRSGDPAAPPAVARFLGALGDRLEADLVDAVRADHAGDTHALDAASRRLGETVGFTLTSAGDGLARRNADADDRNRIIAGLAAAAADKIVVPGAAGRVATPLIRAAAGRLVAASLPTDAEAAQRRATAAATETAGDRAFVEVRALVSRAHPWTAEQAPRAWALPRGAARFWDDQGTPLPESAMTTEQRRAFTAWRREVGLSVYDTAPPVVRDGIEAGVRAAVRETS